MKSMLKKFIGPALAMTAGYFTMQLLMKHDKPVVTTTASASSSSASSASSLKEPVLTLPEFSLKNREGQLQSIRSWPGKSLIINFWATWCAPCRKEIPLLIKIQQDRATSGFQVIGIAIDFREQVLSYAESMHMGYPILIGEQDGMEAQDAFGMGSAGLPFTVFTDEQGNIITTHLGELHPEQAKLILDTIVETNDGKFAVEAARTRLNLALNGSKTP